MNDDMLIQGLKNNPDFITCTTPAEIAAALGIDNETTAPGDKVEFTGKITYTASGTYGGTFVIIQGDDGRSYKFTSSANFAKHINNTNVGILARGNTVSFTATVKEVGDYKGQESVTVTRPRMTACDYVLFQ